MPYSDPKGAKSSVVHGRRPASTERHSTVSPGVIAAYAAGDRTRKRWSGGGLQAADREVASPFAADRLEGLVDTRRGAAPGIGDDVMEVVETL